jgi:hypothetical protein
MRHHLLVPAAAMVFALVGCAQQQTTEKAPIPPTLAVEPQPQPPRQPKPISQACLHGYMACDLRERVIIQSLFGQRPW